MSVDRYLIDHNDFDWTSLLRDWTWILPPSFTVWLMNRFGDLFLVLEDGSIHRLDVEGGTLRKVADSREQFARQVDEGSNADNWLMIPFVDRLVAQGLLLDREQVYSFVKPPVLGGNYASENVCVRTIASHLSFYGQFHRAINDLPDGANVVVRFE